MTQFSVVIVGGGTAGWMTASYLAKAFGRRVAITLVESSRIRTIGVGEATFSTIKLFFDYLGLREHDWMPHCSGAYKLAIRFTNWTTTGGHFYHPFQRLRMAEGQSGAEWWLKLLRGQEPFDYACFTVPALCDALRSPRFLDDRVYDASVHDYFDGDLHVPNVTIADHRVQYPYGYHFNASELADFLQGYAVERGVVRIVDDVVDVPHREDGAIASIRTQENGQIEGDIYVDCTGFRGLLINQTLEEPFQSFGETLLTDQAVALQVPRDIERDGIRPYTTAHAHSAGWSWNIPLYGRDGTGYVYSGAFLSPDEAEREFRTFLGPVSDGCVANHIKMRVGRSRRSWVQNCVAIGLSSGFVEPLESTGIFFIQHGIEELVAHFPSIGCADQALVDSYNKSVADCIDGVRDFLTLHYYASDRMDTAFWRATKAIRIPEGLRECLRLWKSRLPTQRTIYQHFHGFEAYSWCVMLLGLNRQPVAQLPVLDWLDEARAQEMFRSIRAESARLIRELPSHYEYLTLMRQR